MIRSNLKAFGIEETAPYATLYDPKDPYDIYGHEEFRRQNDELKRQGEELFAKLPDPILPDLLPLAIERGQFESSGRKDFLIDDDFLKYRR